MQLNSHCMQVRHVDIVESERLSRFSSVAQLTARFLLSTLEGLGENAGERARED